MPTHRPLRLACLACLLGFLPPAVARAHEGHDADATPKQAAAEMAAAAANFWAALTPEQQAKCGYDVTHDERVNWHFVPKARNGLPIKEMTQPQRDLAQALLATGLSQRGYVQAVTIMSLEQVLYDLQAQQGGKGPVRDAELYFFTLFGRPGPEATWGWRVEGHHLSVNFLIVDGSTIAAAPVFFGSNPYEVKQGPRQGLSVLRNVEELGFQLVRSLDDSQRKVAVIDAVAPKEILTGNKRKAELLDPPGIAASQLTSDQRALLMKLVREYAQRRRAEVAAADLARIEQAGWDKVRFAWAGGFEAGQGHYYRIQGPTFLVEFDNTQNNANHVHTVWRDLEHDFGEDLLAKHYATEHARDGAK